MTPQPPQQPRVLGAPRANGLIRLMVGGVFLVESVLKFLYPGDLAAGRFEKIGIPWPQVTGALVGGVEVICGAGLGRAG